MSVLEAKYMKQAAERVAAVKGKDHAKIYGGLCHAFPVMVRQCGLAQAVAFSMAKAGDTKDRELAHRRIVEDVAAVIGTPAMGILDLGVTEYVVATRRVLSAWIYYKRFAESILKVENAQAAEEDQP